jgi:GT2 family glycosyltransferase
MISICTVCYNDLDFLKILYRSIKKNTKLKYEFLVHDNASEDGTEEWLRENGIDYSRGDNNEGNPALNYSVARAKYSYIFLPNPDTYLLPGWDLSLLREIKSFKSRKIEKFMLSLRCVEPYGNNPEYMIEYCGHNPDTFEEEKLLNFHMSRAFNNNMGYNNQYSFPNCMPKQLWDDFGGMDMDYWPGWTVDVDMAARAYRSGCRDFVLLPSPRVYHFINGTFRNLSKEDNSKNGWDIFQSKWGMTVEDFRKALKITEKYETLPDGLIDV